ncbi:MAG: TadE/TadG family type IV pilus assembly protein [Candidatus Limnocylindria bacterium]
MRLLPARRLPEPTRGQAMVEFAIVLPILAVLLVMAIDFGRVFFGWVALQNATRIAADFAASHPDAWPAGNPDDRDRYQEVVLGDLNAINCERVPAGPIPDPTFPEGTETGDAAVVELDCNFPLITPLAEGILGGPVPVGASATFPINRTIQQGLPPPVAPDPPPPEEESPDPDPDPTECIVPDFIEQGGTKTSAAKTEWSAAGFVPINLIVTPPDDNYKIKDQTIPPASVRPCLTTTMTVDD